MNDVKSDGVMCSQAGCKVSETGICMDGVKPTTECKWAKVRTALSLAEPAGTPDVLSEATDETSTEEFDPDKHVHIRSGKTLSVLDATSVVEESRAVVVAFIGFKDAGKTSLFSSLHNMLQFGPVGDYSFVGSDTVLAFEERCHDTRLASGREAPVTPRSPRQTEPTYLHLALRDKRGCDLTYLFVERSGEDFRDAINDTDFCKILSEFSRADAVVLLVDGEKIVSPTERPVVFANCGTLLQVLLDNGVLGKSDRVDVVLSKADAIASASAGAADAARAGFDAFKQTIVRRFSARVDVISFWEVAACPKAGGFSAGHGVAKLLESWNTNRKKLSVPRLEPASALTTGSNEFEKFGGRYFSRLGESLNG